MVGYGNGCWIHDGNRRYTLNETRMGYCFSCFHMNLVSFATLKTFKNHKILLVGRFEVFAIEFCVFFLSLFLKDTQVASKEVVTLFSYFRHLKGSFHPGIFYFSFFTLGLP